MRPSLISYRWRARDTFDNIWVETWVVVYGWWFGHGWRGGGFDSTVISIVGSGLCSLFLSNWWDLTTKICHLAAGERILYVLITRTLKTIQRNNTNNTSVIMSVFYWWVWILWIQGPNPWCRSELYLWWFRIIRIKSFDLLKQNSPHTNKSQNSITNINILTK